MDSSHYTTAENVVATIPTAQQRKEMSTAYGKAKVNTFKRLATELKCVGFNIPRGIQTFAVLPKEDLNRLMRETVEMLRAKGYATIPFYIYALTANIREDDPIGSYFWVFDEFDPLNPIGNACIDAINEDMAGYTSKFQFFVVPRGVAD